MKYAFITGMGRSGTAFLATLLNKAANAEVKHEWIGNREYWLLSWYLGNKYSMPYLKQIKKSIEKEFSTSSKIFIDVNGYIHHSADAVSRVFATDKIFHLIRDPRKVIPSIYNRRSAVDMQVVPKNEDEIKKWINASKFKQICWNWSDATKRLLSQGWSVIHFEKIISDYGFLCENVLTPLNLEIDEKIWQEIKGRRINRTKSYLYRYFYAKIKGKEFIASTLGEYTEWPVEYVEIFHRVCEPLRKELGYNNIRL